MSAALTLSASRAAGWQAGGQLVSLLFRLGSNLILARFLLPEAWALVGAATSILTLLEWMSDLGTIPTLVRHPNGAQPEWLIAGRRLNILRATAVMLAGMAIAWPYAHWCHLPNLAPILAALSVRPLILALKPPGYPLVRRSMNFRLLVIEELSQTVAGVAVGLALAAWTGSPWSLVAGALAGACVGVAVTWAESPSVPNVPKGWRIPAELRRAGGAIFINTLAMAAWQSIDKVLGPRLIDLEELGLLAVAAGWVIAVEGLGARILEVHFSRMAAMVSLNPDQADKAHRDFFHNLAWKLGPAAALGVLFVPMLVQWAYPSRYQDAGLLLAILTGRMGLRLASQAEFHFLHAKGWIRPATLSFLAAGVVLLVAILPVTSAWGVLGLAWLLVVSGCVQAITQTLFLLRLAPAAFPGWSSWAAICLPVLSGVILALRQT